MSRPLAGFCATGSGRRRSSPSWSCGATKGDFQAPCAPRLVRPERLQRLARRLLLGLLLGASRARPHLDPVDYRGAGEAAVVGGSFGVHDRVDDLLAPSGEQLLELRLVVDVLVGGVR